MTERRLRTPAGLAVLVLAGACSGGDGTDIDARPGGGDTAGPTTTSILPGSGDSAPAGPGSDPLTAPTGQVAPVAPATEPDVVDLTVTVAPQVPETGVPGLDSDDAFCAAWSRFGGSFQVVAVNAAFGSGSVADRALVEVAAGPTVAAAHAAMTESWPAAIESESAVALDAAFGPLARRLGTATDALATAGATADQTGRIDAAWLEFLATRDPTAPEVDLALDPDLAEVVAAAVPGYLAAVGPWAEDETLITDVTTPLTDAYLAAECPDQGILAGGEIDG